MTVNFYKYTGESKVVKKTLPEPAYTAQTVTPYRPLSDLTGELQLDYNSIYYDCNYADFDGKYYFITGRQTMPGQQMILTFRIDVLKTYVADNAFQSLPVIPMRSEMQYNSYMLDSKQPHEVAKYNYVMDPEGADSGLPNACLDYSKLSLIAAVVGTDEPTNTTVEN